MMQTKRPPESGLCILGFNQAAVGMSRPQDLPTYVFWQQNRAEQDLGSRVRIEQYELAVLTPAIRSSS